MSEPSPAEIARWALLTEWQKHVVILLAQGHKCSAIGLAEGVDRTAVDKARARAYKTLRIYTACDATALLLKLRIIKGTLRVEVLPELETAAPGAQRITPFGDAARLWGALHGGGDIY